VSGREKTKRRKERNNEAVGKLPSTSNSVKRKHRQSRAGTSEGGRVRVRPLWKPKEGDSGKGGVVTAIGSEI